MKKTKISRRKFISVSGIALASLTLAKGLNSPRLVPHKGLNGPRLVPQLGDYPKRSGLRPRNVTVWKPHNG